MSAGALVFGLTLGVSSPPAEAGKVCNRLGLSDNCVKGSDVKGRFDLEQDGKNARLRVRNEDGDNAVELDAKRGNVTNLFSDDEDESNGLVKAWARIDADGSVDACWRCDKGETGRTSTGIYKVDFTPLATDITGRPRSATISGAGAVPPAVIRIADIAGDASALNVATNNSATGALTNAPFVLIIY
jgi:hypothetical protein